MVEYAAVQLNGSTRVTACSRLGIIRDSHIARSADMLLRYRLNFSKLQKLADTGHRNASGRQLANLVWKVQNSPLHLTQHQQHRECGGRVQVSTKLTTQTTHTPTC